MCCSFRLLSDSLGNFLVGGQSLKSLGFEDWSRQMERVLDEFKEVIACPLASLISGYGCVLHNFIVFDRSITPHASANACRSMTAHVRRTCARVLVPARSPTSSSTRHLRPYSNRGGAACPRKRRTPGAGALASPRHTAWRSRRKNEETCWSRGCEGRAGGGLVWRRGHEQAERQRPKKKKNPMQARPGPRPSPRPRTFFPPPAPPRLLTRRRSGPPIDSRLSIAHVYAHECTCWPLAAVAFASLPLAPRYTRFQPPASRALLAAPAPPPRGGMGPESPSESAPRDPRGGRRRRAGCLTRSWSASSRPSSPRQPPARPPAPAARHATPLSQRRAARPPRQATRLCTRVPESLGTLPAAPCAAACAACCRVSPPHLPIP